MPSHFTTLELAEADSRLHQLFDYWNARAAAGRRLPSRAQFDPLDLKFVLGSVALIDVVAEARQAPPRFRYRLFGTGYTFYHGRDMTGKWVDEVADPSFREDLLTVYNYAVKEKRVGFYAYDYLIDAQRHRFNAGLFPLADDGETVDRVLTCAVRLE